MFVQMWDLTYKTNKKRKMLVCLEINVVAATGVLSDIQ